jgi:hypothetical protein
MIINNARGMPLGKAREIWYLYKICFISIDISYIIGGLHVIIVFSTRWVDEWFSNNIYNLNGWVRRGDDKSNQGVSERNPHCQLLGRNCAYYLRVEQEIEYWCDNAGDDYAKYISLLTKKARSMIRDLDPTNDLAFLRIKTKN